MHHRHYVPQIARRFVAEPWGGTETVIACVARELPQLGFDADVLCPTILSRRSRERVADLTVRRYPYFYPSWGLGSRAREQLDLKGGNLFSFSLLAALLRANASIYHAHTTKRLGGIVRTAARLRRRPYVVSLHGGYLELPAAQRDELTAPLAGTFEWGRALGAAVGSHRVLEDAAAIICVSSGEQRQLEERLPHKRVLHLPNGVDTARFSGGDGARFRQQNGVADEAQVVLCVGRIDPQKNQLGLVEALAGAPRALRARAHLVLVGGVTDEAYAARVSAAAAQLTSGGATIIEGLRFDDQRLIDAFAAADLFVLPSVHEPFGIVVLEAWAAGKPVLAARVGGLRGLVEHGVNGWLVAPGDVGELRAAMVKLLDDESLRRSLAAAGNALARQRYDWSVIAGEVAALYDEVLACH